MKTIRIARNAAIQGSLWLYLAVSLYPLLYLIFFSLKNNDEIFTSNPLGFPIPIRFGNYADALKSFDIALYFKNSLIVTFASIAAILVLSLMFAYASARMTWKLQSFANSYMLIGLFIPTQVILIPLAVFVRDMGASNTYLGLILPYVAFNLAFSSLIFYSFFRTIPMEIEESAFMDGASIYRTFLQIMLPLVKPAIATVTIFAFMNVWNEFTLSLILATKETIKTLPIGLLSFTGQYATNWGPMGAAMVLSSIPVIVVYLILGDQVEKALTVGSAVKG